MMMTLIILQAIALVLLVILIAFAVALMESMNRTELLVGDLLAYTIEKINAEEAEAKAKPPDAAHPQALSDDDYKTPMVRRSAERLNRRRNEWAR